MAMLQIADLMHQRTWSMCLVCDQKHTFDTPRHFAHHLRTVHCSKEGGSFVCRYGRNGVCPSLPLEGVSDVDYEAHVERSHIGMTLQPETQISSGHNEPKRLLGFKHMPPISFKEDNWTFFSSTQNLAAVLNDPADRKRAVDFFTKTWGAEFEPCNVPPLTLLQNVPKQYFNDYVRKIQHRVKAHVKIKKLQASDGINNELGDTGFSKAALTAAKRQGDTCMNNIDLVPKIFMDNDFTLENSETFKFVIPLSRNDNIEHKHTSSAIRNVPQKSLKLMQEKLTHFLDITEVTLAHQISLKSEDFFLAVSSQDKLQDDVGQTNAAIKHLRIKVKQVRDILCGSSLKFMRLVQLRSQYHAIHNKLKLMSAVQQTQPTIQLLLSTGDFVAALDLISTTQEVLQLELAGVQSLRHLGSQLAELERVIERMMETDFLEFATTNLAKPLEDLEEYEHVIDEERLVSVLFGLLRKQKFHFIYSYKEEAFVTLKGTIKDAAQNFVSQRATSVDNQGLRDAMAKLDFHQWLEMLQVVFKNVLQILTRMKILHQSFVSVLSIAAGQDSLRSANDSNDVLISTVQCGKLSNESKEILNDATELVQTRCVKLINVRARAGFLDSLAPAEFVSLSRTIEKFVVDCEKICGRQSASLRTVLVTQAKKFVERFHEEKKQKLSLILDNERWKQADVPDEFQTLVNSLVDGIPTSDYEIPSLTKRGSATMAPQKPNTHLIVNGERFAVAGTLLLVLKIIVEYCQCVDLMPMLTTDIMNKLFELMKMFNSRTCQLVLGAGALQLVGLKTISAKHLALASRCLEVIILHISTIKSHFELRLPPKQYILLCQFDQILKDYNNHRQEIFSKMVSLMEDLFTSQLSTWEVRPPMPSQVMRNIVKQIIKLHEALLAIIPATQVETVLKDVKRSFKKVLAKKIANLGVKNDFGPQHGLVQSDLAYFSMNLKSLNGMKSVEETCNDIWNLANDLRTNTSSPNLNKNKLPNR